MVDFFTFLGDILIFLLKKLQQKQVNDIITNAQIPCLLRLQKNCLLKKRFI
jgi:hypothetical protein